MSTKWNSNLGGNCPFCKPAQRPDPWRDAQCTLNKPLWMVIPPEGVHLSCPVHPEGHHVFGSSVTWGMQARPWCDYDSSGRPVDYDTSKNRIVEFDATRPWRTTGDTL
jgi:hypothetical protein